MAPIRGPDVPRSCNSPLTFPLKNARFGPRTETCGIALPR